MRFRFPDNPELAFYALGTLQNFVEFYGKAVERVTMLKAHPEQERQLEIYVHCDQRFYVLFHKSFPECATWIPPRRTNGVLDTPDERFTNKDEMCVDIHEDRLNQFELPVGYSVQWLMGQLAGTAPKYIPSICIPEDTGEIYDISIQQGYMLSEWPVGAGIHVIRPGQSLETQVTIAMRSKIVIAEQGFMTAFAMAINKKVLEITPEASHRTLLGFKNYVQVSKLRPHAFLQRGIDRGYSWLLRKSLLVSNVPPVAAPSPNSPAISA